jgi:adenine-specific DNA-methyltransferase
MDPEPGQEPGQDIGGGGGGGSSKKELGQYFTTSQMLQSFVFDKVKHKSSCLLEPSFGAGHLLKRFKEYDDDYPMVCCELDESVEPVVSFNARQTLIYGDFTQEKLGAKFKTIVGNPPYVKQKSGNLYIRFIELCYDLLHDDGEMIFIVPSDFIKLTSAASIIDKMTQNGSFTDFLFPHNEKLFEGASVDVVVFRYEKGCVSSKTAVNGKEVHCNVNKGIITFSDNLISGHPVESAFDVHVGLVSGKDEVYRVPFGNIDVLTDKGSIAKYVFAETFPTTNAQIDAHLLAHKEALMSRRIKKFSESTWFEWGAPRNISSIRAAWGKPCIYVKNMTRSKEVAFVGTVQYFGGTLICLIPKPDTHPELHDIAGYLNSVAFQTNYMYSGRFKIGHKQLSSAIVPIL